MLHRSLCRLNQDAGLGRAGMELHQRKTINNYGFIECDGKKPQTCTSGTHLSALLKKVPRIRGLKGWMGNKYLIFDASNRKPIPFRIVSSAYSTSIPI